MITAKDLSEAVTIFNEKYPGIELVTNQCYGGVTLCIKGVDYGTVHPNMQAYSVINMIARVIDITKEVAK